MFIFWMNTTPRHSIVTAHPTPKNKIDFLDLIRIITELPGRSLDLFIAERKGGKGKNPFSGIFAYSISAMDNLSGIYTLNNCTYPARQVVLPPDAATRRSRGDAPIDVHRECGTQLAFVRGELFTATQRTAGADSHLSTNIIIYCPGGGWKIAESLGDRGYYLSMSSLFSSSITPGFPVCFLVSHVFPFLFTVVCCCVRS